MPFRIVSLVLFHNEWIWSSVRFIQSFSDQDGSGSRIESWLMKAMRPPTILWMNNNNIVAVDLAVDVVHIAPTLDTHDIDEFADNSQVADYENDAGENSRSLLSACPPWIFWIFIIIFAFSVCISFCWILICPGIYFFVCIFYCYILIISFWISTCFCYSFSLISGLSFGFCIRFYFSQTKVSEQCVFSKNTTGSF